MNSNRNRFFSTLFNFDLNAFSFDPNTVDFNPKPVSFDPAHGFLPPYQPAVMLPESSEYNIKLNYLIQLLPELLADKALREVIDTLNVRFANAELTLEKGDKAQKHTALLFLSALAHAYVFENADVQIKALPEMIAKPFYALCKSQQRFPTITYSEYVLHNWQLIDKSLPISLDNIKPIVTLTNTPDEAWFIKIHVMIEYIGGQAISALKNAYDEAKKANPDASLLIAYFNEIQASLAKIIDTMHGMKDHCDPAVFWNTLRPYLGGYEKAKPIGSAEPGVYFAGIDTKDKKPFSYSGPSGAQSSIVPALDAGLKVKHEVDGMYKKLLEFKDYMPNEHQAFILKMTNSKIKHVVKEINNDELSAAFHATVDAVRKMRGAHIGLIHQFIYQPAAKQGIPKEAITGTGGAEINTYLSTRFSRTR